MKQRSMEARNVFIAALALVWLVQRAVLPTG